MFTNKDLQKRYEETPKKSKLNIIITFSKYQKIVDCESIKNVITQRNMYKTILHIVYKRLKKRG